MSSILKEYFPNSKITVLGKQKEKFFLFSFVDEIILADEIPENFYSDYAFECVRGEGSQHAIDDVIMNTIKPQRTLLHVGVSEHSTPINIKVILGKGIIIEGIIIVGCSRSGYEDFQNVIKFLENKKISKRMQLFITSI